MYGNARLFSHLILVCFSNLPSLQPSDVPSKEPRYVSFIFLETRIASFPMYLTFFVCTCLVMRLPRYRPNNRVTLRVIFHPRSPPTFRRDNRAINRLFRLRRSLRMVPALFRQRSRQMFHLERRVILLPTIRPCRLHPPTLK